MQRLCLRSPALLSQISKRLLSSASAESQVLFDCDGAARITTVPYPHLSKLEVFSLVAFQRRYMASPGFDIPVITKICI